MAQQFMVLETALAWGKMNDFETDIRVSVDYEVVIIEPHDHDEPMRIGIAEDDWDALDKFVRSQFPKRVKKDGA